MSAEVCCAPGAAPAGTWGRSGTGLSWGARPRVPEAAPSGKAASAELGAGTPTSQSSTCDRYRCRGQSELPSPRRPLHRPECGFSCQRLEPRAYPCRIGARRRNGCEEGRMAGGPGPDGRAGNQVAPGSRDGAIAAEVGKEVSGLRAEVSAERPTRAAEARSGRGREGQPGPGKGVGDSRACTVRTLVCTASLLPGRRLVGSAQGDAGLAGGRAAVDAYGGGALGGGASSVQFK